MTIHDKVISLLAERLGVETTDIDEDSLLTDDLDMDGVILADFLEDLKKEAQIELPLEEVIGVQTVKELIKLAEEYSKEI